MTDLRAKVRQHVRAALGRYGLCAAAIGFVGALPAAAATYTLIPGYTGAGTSTGVLGINDAGYMTGNVMNGDGTGDAFLRAPDGTYTLFSDGDFQTLGRAINSANQVTGYSYVDANKEIRLANEFRRDADGTITLLHNPVTGDALHGIAQGINSAGVIVGDNYTLSGSHLYRRGYILDGANYTELSVGSDYGVRTEARGINDSGLVVGWTTDSSTGLTRGFLYSGGTYQFVSDPNADTPQATYLEAINNGGVASGDWLDAAGNTHAFLYDTGSNSFTELTPPIPDSYSAFGLNDLGQAVITGASGNNYLYDPAGAPAPGGVPEPGTWTMLVAGFGAVGAALRGRRMRALRWIWPASA